jgi:hypothetical protein
VLLSAYDALFTLARSTLSTSQTETFKRTFEIFTRAIALSSTPAFRAPTASSNARVLHARRALSGAIWNAGAKLYQAGRVGDAIPFLERSSRLAEEVFQLWQSQQPEQRPAGATQRESEGEWKTFEAQLPGRWSTLGACFGKIGERKVSRRFVCEHVLMRRVCRNHTRPISHHLLPFFLLLHLSSFPPPSHSFLFSGRMKSDPSRTLSND